MNKVIVEIINCVDCKNHKILPDPDKYDSFNRDDVKVVCQLANNKEITVACRPYNIRKECEIPDFCPLLSKSNETKLEKLFEGYKGERPELDEETKEFIKELDNNPVGKEKIWLKS